MWLELGSDVICRLLQGAYSGSMGFELRGARRERSIYRDPSKRKKYGKDTGERSTRACEGQFHLMKEPILPGFLFRIFYFQKGHAV